MLTIRYLRGGKKNQPFYRVVVTDKKNPPRAGRFLEIVGFVNPFTKEKQLKADRIKYWLSVGAKPSATLFNLLVEEKVIEAKKLAVHKKSKKKSVESESATDGKMKAASVPENTVTKDQAEKPAAEEPAEQATQEKEPVYEAKADEKNA
ncbi:MAG: 30S ribosomal protein S16 [Candidatus Pacebacteria bacterium]|nr:30S ribosomal protein S16 [Candidatus Paceibacterota bacterium]